MPLVNISLRKGKSPEYLCAVADAVHKALVETYNVPAADRFLLIRQYDRHEFIYDSDYLGIHRTGDVVFIHIIAGNWRDTSTKQALYKRLAQLLVENPGLRPENVQIILSPNGRDDWSFGMGLASYVKESDSA